MTKLNEKAICPISLGQMLYSSIENSQTLKLTFHDQESCFI
jgi:hypothetical protein